MADTVCSIEQGQLKGKKESDIQGTSFISFMGVPYAKPPIGELRFKAPHPPEKWEGIRDATIQGSPCYCVQILPSREGLKMEIKGSEDCLFLNIFTRKLSQKGQNELKPVMVYIHGGAFITGSSDKTFVGPEFLMIEDIVLVTIQYRLGALGFLVIDDPSLEVTGNAGLKDQVQALKWVQKNIKKFNGDPNNVTIFGHSAGGASVHYLMLSPLAQGLFHKAILHSGTALCLWARGTNNTQKLAQLLGCADTKSEKILEFLQKVSVEELLQGQIKFGPQSLSSTVKRHFGPSIEPKSESAFLYQEPLDIIKSGSYNHVPVIFGYTSEEGMIETFGIESGLGGNFEDFVPYYFGYEKNSIEFDETNRKIEKFYFGDEKPALDNLEMFYDVFTDTIFLNGIYKALKAHIKTSRELIYYYRVTLDTDLNLFKKIGKFETKGVCHGDDMGYLFSYGYNLKPGSIEEISVFRFVKMWTNFAKTGKPISEKDFLLDCEWKAVTETELNFLDIGTKLVSGTDPDIERMKFWEEIDKDIKYHY